MLLQCMATAAFGIEGITASELREMGLEKVRAEDSHVYFEGGLDDIARANMWLRTADRVYIVLDTFEAVTFDGLFEHIKAYPWENWLDKHSAFPLTGKCIRSSLMSISDCQSIIKKAIVERLKGRYGISWFQENEAKYSVVFSIVNDKVSVMLDTSGEGLHRRGYRTYNTSAPLRETMAAALLRITRYEGQRPLIDPFCGSGTIPIEAYMMAADRAPGLLRDFECFSWEQMPFKIAEHVREEANDRYNRTIRPEIIGYDIDGSVLNLARKHAKQAGVGEMHFQQADVRSLSTSKRDGMFICNPPYGQRLLEKRQAEALYRDMRKVFDKAGSWRQYILTSHPNFERIYGRRADARRKLYNGRIECCFYQYFRT